MKKVFILACVVLLAACSQQEEKKAPALSLDSEGSKLAYAIGMDIGMSLKTLGTDLDRAVMISAINDRLDGVDTKLSQEDANKVKQAFFVKQAEKKAADQKAAGEKNKVDGAAFLAEHAKKEGVTVTPSGLHYQVILQGEGAKPTTEKWWKRLRRQITKRAVRIPREGPTDGPDAEIWALPSALESIRNGTFREMNPM